MRKKSVIGQLVGAGTFAFLAASALGSAPAQASPLYNGGPVISGTPDVFYIWYGNWGSDSALSLLPAFVRGLSGTTYLATDKSMGGNGLVTYGGSASVSSFANSSLYLGSSLNNPLSQIESIVNGVLSHGLLPRLANGVYDVLTAPGIFVNGFNTQYCGWHSSTNWGGALGTQFGFIGDPTASQTGCYVQGPNRQYKTSPNGNFGADAMTSVIAHELMETVTDPTGRAFWDSNSHSSTYGLEGGDMCSWNFGSVYRAPNGSYANLSVGGRNYLVQQQWVNTGGGLGYAGGHCAMSYSGPSGANPIAGNELVTPAAVAALVPEPLTLATFGAGLTAVSALRRKRRQN